MSAFPAPLPAPLPASLAAGRLERAEALVIGGGLAGGAVAAHLASKGRAVTLLERTAGPHDKVCGEFLSFEAVHYLRALGIDLDRLGAVAIRHVCLHGRRGSAACELPFAALSVSRRVLDEAVLQQAAAAGAEVRRGCPVQALRRTADGWAAQLEGGRAIASGDVFLATGKSDLRGWRRQPGRHNGLIGFKQHWHGAAGAGPCVELFLFPGGYAGLEPAENGILNLCLLVERRRFTGLGSRFEALLAALLGQFPRLRALLEGAHAPSKPLAVGAVPYGFVQRRGDGLWRLGDQAAVIPSFCGDGMAIALHSARMAADYYLHGRTSGAFQADLAGDVALQVSGATALSRLIVHPAGQAAAMGLMRMAPSLIRLVSRGTRIAGGRLRAGQPGAG